MGKIIQTTDIIQQFKNKHGNKYDYSLVNYINTTTKVKVICKIHGVFTTLPISHKISGCRKCYNESKVSSTTEFISKSKEIHKDLYDYSKTTYIRSNMNIKLICNIHGKFDIIPSNHLKGRGCQICAWQQRYVGKVTILYYIKIKNQYKIGVCCLGNFKSPENAINSRYHKENKLNIKFEIINYDVFNNGEEAYSLEQKIIKNNREKLIQKEDMILLSGFTETFTEDISLFTN